MSRLDIFTIVVVVICVAAIVFLLYRTTDLFKSRDALKDAQQTEESIYDDDGTTGDDYTDDPYYSDSDTAAEFDFLADTSSDSPAPASPKPSVSEPAPVPSEETAPVNVDEMTDSGGDYLVLAGAFVQMANAEAHAKRLQKLGFSDARVALFNRGKYATVLVGRFESKSDATSLVSQLSGKGVESYVHLKRGSGAN